MEIVMKKMETFCPRKEHLTMVAAAAGSAWAMEKVATFYEEGYGCTANRALADACRETLKYMR